MISDEIKELTTKMSNLHQHASNWVSERDRFRRIEVENKTTADGFEKKVQEAYIELEGLRDKLATALNVPMVVEMRPEEASATSDLIGREG